MPTVQLVVIRSGGRHAASPPARAAIRRRHGVRAGRGVLDGAVYGTGNGAAQADHMPARGAGSGATCGVGSGTTGGASLDEVLHVGLDIGSTTTKVFVLDPTANETRYWRY